MKLRKRLAALALSTCLIMSLVPRSGAAVTPASDISDVTVNLFDYQAGGSSGGQNGTGVNSYYHGDGENGAGFWFYDNSAGVPSITDANGAWKNGWSAGKHDQNPTEDIVRYNLAANKLPAFNPDTKDGLGTEVKNTDTGYLFDPNSITDGKTAYADVQGLFKQGADGYYYYDSARNHAQYNSGNNCFDIKDYALTEAGGGRRGQFLPFNRASTKADGPNAFEVERPVNFWFGMHINTGFMQPRNGLIKGANDGAQPMVFRFSGDDDVWVFVDGLLFLDIGGLHSAIDGRIDFEAGLVIINKNHADQKTVILTFEDLLRRAYIEREGNTDGLDAYLAGQLAFDGERYTTFKNYSAHTLDFFYLERGAGVSNCSIAFNLITLGSYDLAVTKELGGDINGGIAGFGIQFGYKLILNGTVPHSGITYHDLNDPDKTPRDLDEGGTFRLRDGETIILKGLLESDKFEIIEEGTVVSGDLEGLHIGFDRVTITFNSEKEAPEVVLQDGTKPSTGTYRAGEVQSVAFRNTVSLGSKLGALKIEKIVEGTPVLDALERFDMEVRFAGNLYGAGGTGGAYTLYTETAGSITTEEKTTTNGLIPLRDGQWAVIDGLPGGTRYSVRELTGDGWVYFEAPEYRLNGDGVDAVKDAALSLKDDPTVVTVVNTAAAPRISITKEADRTAIEAPGSGDPDRPLEADITYTLTVENGCAMPMGDVKVYDRHFGPDTQVFLGEQRLQMHAAAPGIGHDEQYYALIDLAPRGRAVLTYILTVRLNDDPEGEDFAVHVVNNTAWAQWDAAEEHDEENVTVTGEAELAYGKFVGNFKGLDDNGLPMFEALTDFIPAVRYEGEGYPTAHDGGARADLLDKLAVALAALDALIEAASDFGGEGHSLSDFRAELTALRDALEDAEADLAEVDGARAILEAAIADACEALEAAIEDAEADTTDLEARLAELETELAELEPAHTLLAGAVAAIEAELEALNACYVPFEHEGATYTTFDALWAAYTALQDEIIGIRDDLDGLPGPLAGGQDSPAARSDYTATYVIPIVNTGRSTEKITVTDNFRFVDWAGLASSASLTELAAAGGAAAAFLDVRWAVMPIPQGIDTGSLGALTYAGLAGITDWKTVSDEMGRFELTTTLGRGEMLVILATADHYRWGGYVNRVTVTAEDGYSGSTLPEEAIAGFLTTPEYRALLSVTKTVDDRDFAAIFSEEAGIFTIKVYNHSAVPGRFTLSDILDRTELALLDSAGAIAQSGTVYALEGEGTMTFTVPFRGRHSDREGVILESGLHCNTALLESADDDTLIATGRDSAMVAVTERVLELELTKTADRAWVPEGTLEDVGYALTVKVSGSEGTAALDIHDSMFGLEGFDADTLTVLHKKAGSLTFEAVAAADIALEDGVLTVQGPFGPGDVLHITYVHPVPRDAPAGAEIVNTAFAEGVGSYTGEPCRSNEAETVVEIYRPTVAVSKKVTFLSEDGQWRDTISAQIPRGGSREVVYQMTITLTGNQENRPVLIYVHDALDGVDIDLGTGNPALDADGNVTLTKDGSCVLRFTTTLKAGRHDNIITLSRPEKADMPYEITVPRDNAAVTLTHPGAPTEPDRPGPSDPKPGDPKPTEPGSPEEEIDRDDPLGGLEADDAEVKGESWAPEEELTNDDVLGGLPATGVLSAPTYLWWILAVVAMLAFTRVALFWGRKDRD